MSLKILSPFGPKMAKLSLPKSLVAKINQEVDKIITSNILSKKYNYSKKLAGEVEQEIETVSYTHLTLPTTPYV